MTGKIRRFYHLQICIYFLSLSSTHLSSYQNNTTTRIWVPKGTRPRTAKQQQYESLYLFGAFCPEKDIAVGFISPNVNTYSMQVHLKLISEKISSGEIAAILVDRASWHTSLKLVIPENIVLVFLPAASPELNSAEQYWS